MRISTKGRYALRLMLDLAENRSEKFTSLKDISARQDISVKYLEQIIGSLCKSGLIVSGRGPQGGYRLAKEPEDYTVGDILRAAEGNLSPVACIEEEINRCPRTDECLTVDLWRNLQKVIYDYVDSVSLRDLLNGDVER